MYVHIILSHAYIDVEKDVENGDLSVASGCDGAAWFYRYIDLDACTHIVNILLQIV